jgi:DNA-binding winged helix-turn-helix (wHTH) protein
MPWVFDQFALDQDRRQLLRAGSPVALEPKAYELLSLLLARRPRAVPKAQIRDALWPGTFVSESALAGLITDLRSVLGDNARRPRFIRTVHGFGYAFSGEAREDGQPVDAHGGPVLRTLVLSSAGSVQWFDRPIAALIAALAESGGAAVHVVEFTPGTRPPGFLQRLASLAEPRQVLLSRAAFDLGRDAADSGDDGLVWLAHGPYLFEGLRDPLDVFEVGRPGLSLLRPPADTKSARRAVRPGDEVTLGWRPAPGLSIPGREGWTFVDKLGEGATAKSGSPPTREASGG